MKQANVKKLTITAMFIALILVLGMTPIGLIPLPLLNATTLHIPVIVGAIVLGPRIGATLGFTFGLMSFWRATTSPTISSFLFSPLVPVPGTEHGSLWAIFIAFVPRILIGIVSYYAFVLGKKLFTTQKTGNLFPVAFAAFCGSMTNTVLVLGSIYLLFRDAYASAMNIASNAVGAFVLTAVGTSGVPEALAAIIFAVAICKPLLKITAKERA